MDKPKKAPETVEVGMTASFTPEPAPPLRKDYQSDGDFARAVAAYNARGIWTPCKHFKQCIGYCPYCIAEKMQKETK